MKSEPCSEEQVIGRLHGTAAGATAIQVCRGHGVSETRRLPQGNFGSALPLFQLPVWLRHYNHERPHGSLAGRPPASRLPAQVNNLVEMHT